MPRCFCFEQEFFLEKRENELMQEHSKVIAAMPDGEQKRRAEVDFADSRKARLQAKADAASNRAAALAAHLKALEEAPASKENTVPVEMPLLLKTAASDEIESTSTNRRDR